MKERENTSIFTPLYSLLKFVFDLVYSVFYIELYLCCCLIFRRGGSRRIFAYLCTKIPYHTIHSLFLNWLENQNKSRQNNI